MSKLVLFMPDGTTLDVALKRERTTIGRRADNDICLPNLAVSGEHAVVVTILADSFLEDLGSTNGTLVNGKAIAKHFLRDRDQIDIGRHKLIYCMDDDATMSSELVGLARITARDYGERVEPARPFVRAPFSDAVTPLEAEVASDAAANALATPLTAPAPILDHAVAEPGTPATPRANTAAVASPASPPGAALASVKVLSGVNAGVLIPLVKPETTIGRPGVQVASIVKAGDAFRLKPLEGVALPAVNGRPVERDGSDLAPGDVVEIAGTRLEFIATGGQPEPGG